MTFKPIAGGLAWPLERPFRYLLLASVLAPLVVLILAAVIAHEHLITAATTEARKTVDVLHEHTLKVMETQELALNQIDDRTRSMSWEEIATSEALFQDLRRLVARLPQFDGAVGTSLSVEYFTRFYQSIAENNGAAIALGRTDGEVLARYPLLDKPLTRFAPDGAVMSGLAAGHERWTDIAAPPQDGVERIYAFRKVQPYPLVVVYGIPKALITQRWLTDLAAFAGFAALAAASLAAATLFAAARAQSDKRMAEVLRTREAEFRASFELGAVGKVQADPETGRFLRVNATFCRMTGYPWAELL